MAAGKSRFVYLLGGAALGGIGGQEASLTGACGDDIDGGVAVLGSIVYLPCLSGPVAVQAARSPAGVRLLWSTPVGGGPPVVVAGLVWTVSQDGNVYGLSPTTGAVREQARVGLPANHFSTPSVGAGLFLVATANRVVAFAAPAAATPSSTTTTPSTTTTAAPSPTTTAPATATTTPSAGGGSNAWVITAAVVAGAAVLAGVAWALVRRRRGGRPRAQ